MQEEISDKEEAILKDIIAFIFIAFFSVMFLLKANKGFNYKDNDYATILVFANVFSSFTLSRILRTKITLIVFFVLTFLMNIIFLIWKIGFSQPLIYFSLIVSYGVFVLLNIKKYKRSY